MGSGEPTEFVKAEDDPLRRVSDRAALEARAEALSEAVQAATDENAIRQTMRYAMLRQET